MMQPAHYGPTIDVPLITRIIAVFRISQNKEQLSLRRSRPHFSRWYIPAGAGNRGVDDLAERALPVLGRLYRDVVRVSVGRVGPEIGCDLFRRAEADVEN
jgi:hypothetical protein